MITMRAAVLLRLCLLVLSGILFSAAGRGAAEEFLPLFDGNDGIPDPRLRLVRVTGERVPFNDPRLSTREMVVVYETWSSSDPVDPRNADYIRIVGIQRWELATAQDAQVWPDGGLSWHQQGGIDIPGFWGATFVGDRSLLVGDEMVFFVRGRTVVRVFVSGGLGSETGFGEEYLLNLARKVDAKLAPPPGSLVLQVSVPSKHVQPHLGRVVQVRVSSNTRPMRYDFQIYRVKDRNLPGALGDLVYSTINVRSADRVADFTWAGSTTSGWAHNGNYELVITGTDGYGRTARKTVDVQVNFQGK